MSKPSRKRGVTSLLVGLGVGVILLTLGVGAIAWISSIYDEHGKPVLDVPAATVITVVAAPIAGAVAAAIYKLIGIEKQVANDHVDEEGNPILMRDDNDHKHIELKKLTQDLIAEVRAVRAEVAETKSSVRGVQRDVGRLATTDQQNHTDLSQLRKEFADHVTWSQAQQARIDGLEGGKK